MCRCYWSHSTKWAAVVAWMVRMAICHTQSDGNTHSHTNIFIDRCARGRESEIYTLVLIALLLLSLLLSWFIVFILTSIVLLTAKQPKDVSSQCKRNYIHWYMHTCLQCTLTLTLYEFLYWEKRTQTHIHSTLYNSRNVYELPKTDADFTSCWPVSVSRIE